MFCLSHGHHDDLKLALKHTHLWVHQVLMIMAWKAWLGPFGSKEYWQMVLDCVTANFKSLTPQEDVCFPSYPDGYVARPR